jgi:II/X family phage/plasmid replication protein
MDTGRFKAYMTKVQYGCIAESLVEVPYFDKLTKDIKHRRIGKIIFPPFNTDFTFLINDYESDFVYFEGSLPKLWYGENIHLLYANQFKPVLELLNKGILKAFGEFAPIELWEIQRLDLPYAWKFENEEKSKDIIQYIKENVEYPRKNKHPYGLESVDFGNKGSTKVKFYRKLPEFKKGDYKHLNLLLEVETDELLKLAEGVVRFEVTLRKQDLQIHFKKKSITYDLFLDQEVIFGLIRKYLFKFEVNADKELLSDEQLIQQLLTEFKTVKAIRLFCFYKAYWQSSIKARKLIKKYMTTGELSANKKAIKQAQISLPNITNTASFDFEVPSTSVINTEPEPSAVAEELARRLKMIDEVGIVVKGEASAEFISTLDETEDE